MKHLKIFFFLLLAFFAVGATQANAYESSDDITIVVSHTITFDANDVNGETEGTMSPQTITEGESANLNTNNFTKRGYSFAGWATTEGGSNAYDDGQLYTMGITDVTLYAVWVTNADLTVTGYVTPTTTYTNTLTNFSSTIKNVGTMNTGNSFPYFFQIASDSNFSSNLVNKTSSTMLSLGAGVSGNATVSHTFTSAGTYYMRVCADKTSPSGGGLITESDENNNCGAATAITVTQSLPDLTAYKTAHSSGESFSVYGYPTTFNAVIENIGNATTGKSFNYLFQVKNSSDGYILREYSNLTPTLVSGGVAYLDYSYDVDIPLTYQVRLCVDKSNSSDVAGVVSESNENNNCGEWSDPVTVTAFDFTAGSVTPTNVAPGVNTFTSSITNASTLYYSPEMGDGLGLPYLVQGATGANGSGTITNISARYNNDIPDHGGTVDVSWSYNMSTTGTHSMRLCADKYNQGDEEGQVKEMVEDNNCGPWTNISVVGVMSGSLSGNTSCTIIGTGNSCSIPVNWSILYPEGDTTAITYLNGSDNTQQSITVSSSKTPDSQSGTKSLSIYYSPSGRRIYLYNNAKELKSIIVSANCDTANNYIWGDDVGHCVPGSYTVTASGGTGGSFDVSSKVVARGTTTTFTAIPSNAGYLVSTISSTCDGSPLFTNTNNTKGSIAYTTGAITDNCAITAVFKSAPSGSLTVTNCEIKSGQSACSTTLLNPVTITWEVLSPIIRANTAVTTTPPDNTIVGTGNSGTTSQSYDCGGYDDLNSCKRNFYLYHNSDLLKSALLTPFCTPGTSWFDHKCTPDFYTVTASGGTGGGFDVSSKYVARGTTATFSAVPSSARYLVNTISSTCAGSTDFINTSNTQGPIAYTTGPINANCAISATFRTTSYNVSTLVKTDGVVSGAGGTISPLSKLVYYGEEATFTIKTNPGYSSHVSGCGGTPADKTTTPTTGLITSTYTTGNITAPCTVELSFTLNPMVGTLLPTEQTCLIPLGGSICKASLDWAIEVPRGLTTSITSEGMTNRDVSTNMTVYQSGKESFDVPYTGNLKDGLRKFYLYNNATELATAKIISKCDPATSTWNSTQGKCTGSTGTIKASDCIIGENNDECYYSQIEWEIIHPVGETAITTPDHITVLGTENVYSGITTYTVKCTGGGSVSECQRTFYLYDGGNDESLLDQATATARCSNINKWNVTDHLCRYQPPILTLNATPCIIPLNQSSCNTTLTWATEYYEKNSVLKMVSPLETLSTENSGSLIKNISFLESTGGVTTFTLTNKDRDNKEIIVSADATVVCAPNTHWDETQDKCLIDPPSPDNITFTAIPSVILIGKSSTLSWDASKVIDLSLSDNSCTISEQLASEQEPSVVIPLTVNKGSKKVTPNETTTYTLKCVNSSSKDDDKPLPILIKVVSITVKEN